jgi:ribosome-binding protein aMBF1 (putative translation factor)
MRNTRKPVQGRSGESTYNGLARDETIAEKYNSQPSPRALSRSGQIERQAVERAERVRASGPPARPFGDLIAALRAERERQGLSLSDVAKRTGMERAAIHKLEIGLNSNPTHATLARYATALGTRIEWQLKTIPKKPIIP